jgi:hypothetical protein
MEMILDISFTNKISDVQSLLILCQLPPEGVPDETGAHECIMLADKNVITGLLMPGTNIISIFGVSYSCAKKFQTLRDCTIGSELLRRFHVLSASSLGQLSSIHWQLESLNHLPEF